MIKYKRLKLMKESDNNNNEFYSFSDDNDIDTNNNLILEFSNNSPKESEIFEDNSKNDTYKITLGKNKHLNEILYETNEIATSKYNLLNIFPKILMEQFSRICNIYLLIIALFQSIKSISYTDGSPLILISLTALILLNGFKDCFEDRKRKKSDKIENNNEILIYDQNTKSFVQNIWKNIKFRIYFFCI